MEGVASPSASAGAYVALFEKMVLTCPNAHCNQLLQLSKVMESLSSKEQELLHAQNLFGVLASQFYAPDDKADPAHLATGCSCTVRDDWGETCKLLALKSFYHNEGRNFLLKTWHTTANLPGQRDRAQEQTLLWLLRLMWGLVQVDEKQMLKGCIGSIVKKQMTLAVRCHELVASNKLKDKMKKKNFTVYVLDLVCDGKHSVLKKRYSEIETFYKQLAAIVNNEMQLRPVGGGKKMNFSFTGSSEKTVKRRIADMASFFDDLLSPSQYALLVGYPPATALLDEFLRIGHHQYRVVSLSLFLHCVTTSAQQHLARRSLPDAIVVGLMAILLGVRTETSVPSEVVTFPFAPLILEPSILPVIMLAIRATRLPVALAALGHVQGLLSTQTHNVQQVAATPDWEQLILPLLRFGTQTDTGPGDDDDGDGDGGAAGRAERVRQRFEMSSLAANIYSLVLHGMMVDDDVQRANGVPDINEGGVERLLTGLILDIGNNGVRSTWSSTPTRPWHPHAIGVIQQLLLNSISMVRSHVDLLTSDRTHPAWLHLYEMLTVFKTFFSVRHRGDKEGEACVALLVSLPLLQQVLKLLKSLELGSEKPREALDISQVRFLSVMAAKGIAFQACFESARSLLLASPSASASELGSQLRQQLGLVPYDLTADQPPNRADSASNRSRVTVVGEGGWGDQSRGVTRARRATRRQKPGAQGVVKFLRARRRRTERKAQQELAQMEEAEHKLKLEREELLEKRHTAMERCRERLGAIAGRVGVLESELVSLDQEEAVTAMDESKAELTLADAEGEALIELLLEKYEKGGGDVTIYVLAGRDLGKCQGPNKQGTMYEPDSYVSVTHATTKHQTAIIKKCASPRYNGKFSLAIEPRGLTACVRLRVYDKKNNKRFLGQCSPSVCSLLQQALTGVDAWHQLGVKGEVEVAAGLSPRSKTSRKSVKPRKLMGAAATHVEFGQLQILCQLNFDAKVALADDICKHPLVVEEHARKTQLRKHAEDLEARMQRNTQEMATLQAEAEEVRTELEGMEGEEEHEQQRANGVGSSEALIDTDDDEDEEPEVGELGEAYVGEVAVEAQQQRSKAMHCVGVQCAKEAVGGHFALTVQRIDM